jgi:tetratricopeptide (TPR) repeat protein
LPLNGDIERESQAAAAIPRPSCPSFPRRRASGRGGWHGSDTGCKGRGEAKIERNVVRGRLTRSVPNKLIVLLLLLCGLLPVGPAMAEEGEGGNKGDGKDVTAGLSVGASRVLYEAQQLIEKEEYDKAIRILEKYIEKHADRNHCLVEFTLGNALYLAGNKESCLAHYKAAEEMNPAFGPAWVNLGQVAYDLKRYGLAAQALTMGFDVAEEDEKDPDLLYYAAVAHILDGHQERAAPILEALVSGRHGDPDKEWFQALLNIYLDLDQEEKAGGLIEQMMRRYGDQPETWRLSYQFEASRQNYRMAAVALTIYSYLAPLTREEAVLLGDLFATIKVPLLACVQYEKAFASGASAEEYERLASAYLAAHRPVQARQILVGALESKPTANLWSLVGDMNYMEEDFEGAYYAFEESARLDPRDGRAYLMMGYCALQLDKKKLAAEALKKARGFPKQRQAARDLLKQVQ